MTPEERQQKQAELAALRSMDAERLNARRHLQVTETALKEVGYLLSERDKAIYTQLAAEKQQYIKDIVDKWQQDPYNVAPGRDGIYQAMREREDALGIPHQERQEPQIPPTVGDWKQTADQRAGQPLETHELVKKMQDLDASVQQSKQIQEEAAKNSALKLSDIGKQYLENQKQDAARELTRMAHEHTEAFQQYRHSPSTFRSLDFENLQTKIKEINSEALHAKFKEAEDRQREQTRTQTKTKDR